MILSAHFWPLGLTRFHRSNIVFSSLGFSGSMLPLFALAPFVPFWLTDRIELRSEPTFDIKPELPDKSNHFVLQHLLVRSVIEASPFIQYIAQSGYQNFPVALLESLRHNRDPIVRSHNYICILLWIPVLRPYYDPEAVFLRA